MIDRSLFTPDGSNPPYPVPFNDYCTVPTREMAELLASLLNTKGYVLEIGTGSGYQTAVLAEHCEGVVSIEVDPLPHVAGKLPSNVVLIAADGCLHDTGEQFDAILVTFSSFGVSETWLRQLKPGGRLIMPWQIGQAHPICVLEKVGDMGIHIVDIPAYAPFTRAIHNA